MAIVDCCPTAFNAFGRRPRFRWFVFLCVFASSLWLLLFSPYALTTSFDLTSPFRQPQPQPQPQPAQPLPQPPEPDHPKQPTQPPQLPDHPKPPPTEPPQLPKPTYPENWETAKQQVRNAFKYALDGYLKQAYPYDELRAVTGGGKNKFNGWGVTLYDSLDTMWIMDLKDEFNHALSLISKQDFAPSATYAYAPFFETVIRYLGGLLSAYALSKEPSLLAQADELGLRLLPVFNGTQSGLPAYSVHTQTGRTGMGWVGTMVLFAEATSCQLEYKYLAKLTGRKEYYERVEHVMDIVYNTKSKDGLFSDKWTGDGKQFGEHYTVGGKADSGYEYFLKQWLLMGDTKARDQYLISMQGTIDNLLYLTANRELLFVTDTIYNKPTNLFEHLSCFLPGLLALGAHTPTLTSTHLPPKTRQLHKWAAEGLAYTCYLMYADQKSGLGPDGVRMIGGEKWMDSIKNWERRDSEKPSGVPPGLRESGPVKEGNGPKGRDYTHSQAEYYLRPETVESFYIMYKTTGDVKWRQRGWEIFQAIESVAKTKYGYGSISNVDRPPHLPMDDMPSFFLAETLKYLYLLFDDTDLLSLDKWVFNTEAHPLPVFEWTDEEREKFGIPPPGS